MKIKKQFYENKKKKFYKIKNFTNKKKHSYNLSSHHAITCLHVCTCIITTTMHLLLAPIAPQ